MKKFFFKHENYGEEFRPIEAFDFEDAAEKFAEKNNTESDYYLMNDEDTVIISDGEVEKVFKIGAESDIRYWSREVNP